MVGLIWEAAIDGWGEGFRKMGLSWNTGRSRNMKEEDDEDEDEDEDEDKSKVV